MAIQFNSIPSNLRVPLWYAEINAAQTPYQSNSRLLLIGQRTSQGTATVNERTRVFNDPRGLFGTHSMLARMCEIARMNAPLREIWAIPVDDAATGVAATGQIVVRLPTAARVVSVANVTLAGGAPNTVDGVSLSAGDLVLCTAQTAGSENGLYSVTTLGTGTDGTWTRATSMDAAAEVWQYRTFNITEGTVYANSSWEITTAGPFTLGTTALAFAQTATVVQGFNSNTTVAVWVAGQRVRTIAYTSDTAITLATRLAAAINDVDQTEGHILPATAASTDAVITLTARHAGEQGNSIRLEANYFGQEGPTSENIFSFTQFTGGTGDPDITTALASMGDEEFDWIAAPYSDAVNMAAVSLELNGSSGRWSPTQQLYGHYITHRNATSTDLASYGATLNDEHVTLFGSYNSPSPTWDWVAAIGGVAVDHLQEAPELSRPLQTINLLGIMAPKLSTDRFDITTRQSLYFDGISGYHVEKDGTVSIDRLITTYQLNEWGSPDSSWLDVNTIAQTMYGIRYLKAKVTGHWGRAALADDNPQGVLGLATPADVRATIVHGYRELVGLGVFENEDEFEERLIVERNQVDPNRLDVYLPADHVNQLRIIAVNYVSHLQYQTN